MPNGIAITHHTKVSRQISWRDNAILSGSLIVGALLRFLGLGELVLVV